MITCFEKDLPFFFKVTIINNYIHVILRDKSQTKNEYEPVDRTRKAINWLLAAFTVGGYEDLRILKFAMPLIIIIYKRTTQANYDVWRLAFTDVFGSN